MQSRGHRGCGQRGVVTPHNVNNVGLVHKIKLSVNVVSQYDYCTFYFLPSIS